MSAEQGWDDDVVELRGRVVLGLDLADAIWVGCLVVLAVIPSGLRVVFIVALLATAAFWAYAAWQVRDLRLRISAAGVERSGRGYTVRVPWQSISNLERSGTRLSPSWSLLHDRQPILGPGADGSPDDAALRRAEKRTVDVRTSLSFFVRDPRTGEVGDRLRRHRPDIVVPDGADAPAWDWRATRM